VSKLSQILSQTNMFPKHSLVVTSVLIASSPRAADVHRRLNRFFFSDPCCRQPAQRTPSPAELSSVLQERRLLHQRCGSGCRWPSWNRLDRSQCTHRAQLLAHHRRRQQLGYYISLFIAHSIYSLQAAPLPLATLPRSSGVRSCIILCTDSICLRL
jgi:hypothetical protein